MRKLGLVLVLLFTLSIVSATDFTLSGKITPKAGVTALVDGDYPAAFTFSDGTSYNGQVTMTNGVFVADFSGMTNAESAIANSDTVTMGISALGGTQTFSNIPLTTVPKAVYATQAGQATQATSAHLRAPKTGAENTDPLFEIKHSDDTTTTDNGRYWHFRSGGAALPTVFSFYGNKQLELNRELATFYGGLNVAGTTIFSGPIRQDRGTIDDNYDVWIQGSKTINTHTDKGRNLALLGVANTDKLHVNFAGEYEGGTVIGSATSPTSVMGDLNVGGVITGDGSGITGLVGGNSINKVEDTSTGAKVTGELEATTHIKAGKYLWLKDYDGDATESKLYSRDNELNIIDSTKISGDLSVTGTMFGEWIRIADVLEDTSISGTATSDGFLVVYLSGSNCETGEDSHFTIETPIGSTKARAKGYNSATTPVAKGDTWKVDNYADSHQTCVARTYWLPIGASTTSNSHGYTT